MTAHELAHKLLAGPDIDVAIDVWTENQCFLLTSVEYKQNGDYQYQGNKPYKFGEVIYLSYED